MTDLIKENKIHVLDAGTANRIAAGEVAERPANIIKELVENSIDAGATRIEIHILDRNCEKIQITDNGCGMSPADMRLSVIRHATSKISRAEDLESLHTLGFRGEALPSIAAVSQMTITSKLAGSKVGYRMLVDGGIAGIPEETAAQDGTIILLDRLFYNTPARKKFMRSANTELAAVTDVVGNLAMSHTDIAFTLKRGNFRSIVTQGKGDLKQIMMDLYGLDVSRNLFKLCIRSEEDDITIHGLISVPEFNRSSRQYHLFVNGRPVNDKVLNAAIEESYYTLMPVKRYPIVFLFVELPADQVDVNVHPSKLEVKFGNPETVRSVLSKGIEVALYKRDRLEPRCVTDFRPGDVVDDLPQTKQPRPKPPVDKRPLAEQLNMLSQPASDRKQQSSIDLFRQLYQGMTLIPPKSGKKYCVPEWYDEKLDEIKKVDSDDSAAPVEAEKPQIRRCDAGKKLIYSQLHIIGQYLGTYILATGDEGLYIIDQHAAAERVNYEKLAYNLSRKIHSDSSMLAIPIKIQLSDSDHLLLTEYIVKVTDLGFILEYQNNATYLIRGVPVWCEKTDADDLLLTMLDFLRDFYGNGEESLVRVRAEEMFMTACKQSVRANRYLTDQDISALLAELDKCRRPYSCPHGRPIAILLTERDIRSRFLRS